MRLGGDAFPHASDAVSASAPALRKLTTTTYPAAPATLAGLSAVWSTRMFAIYSSHDPTVRPWLVGGKLSFGHR